MKVYIGSVIRSAQAASVRYTRQYIYLAGYRYPAFNKVAIKIIDKENDDYESMKDVIENEIEILSDLPNSPYLVNFYEVDYLYLEIRNRG